MTAPRKPIVLAAGGTGGHVFPAIALAQELLARDRRVVLITDQRGDTFGDAAPGLDIRRISAGRIDGNPVHKIRGIVALGAGYFQAARLLRGIASGAVVGFGGYPSLPTVAAATRMGLATLIHEQNAVLGRVNRLVSTRVSKIATAYPEVRGCDDPGRVVMTGNPVRPAIVQARKTPYPTGTSTVRLLIIGGSQGAQTLGRVVPAAIAKLPEAVRGKLEVSQQCREEDLADARDVYASCGVDAEVETFFNDVPERLARAHLVVSRAGASSIAELGCVGRPAILVPYPHATDDHQTANARAVKAAGAAWLMADSDVTEVKFGATLEALLADHGALVDAAAAAFSLGRPDAAARLADAVEALAESGRNGSHGPDVREEAA